MPLDPAAKALLDQLEAAGGPALNEMEPADARVAAEGFAALGGPGEEVADITDRTIPGPGGDIPVRIYTPAGSGSKPCLVYFHGGGWVIGDISTTDSVCRVMANQTGAVVVSVDYRLAPEHKFPAPLDDCEAAVRWVAANASAIGVDASRVAVGGDSAGGNLSAAVALKLRDTSGPKLCFQLLIYPVTDHRLDSGSYKANGEGHLLTTDMMRWFWDHYVSSPADSDNPYVSPLRAKDLSGLPPALVITAEYDPLRDEGEAYASAMQAAGVAVTTKRYDGLIHGFFPMLAAYPTAADAARLASDALIAAFAR